MRSGSDQRGSVSGRPMAAPEILYCTMALLSRGADMATAVSRKTLLTAADLLKLIDRLGGIDPARVRLRPMPGTATEKDILRAEREPQKALCELVDGTLVEKPMGYRES